MGQVDEKEVLRRFEAIARFHLSEAAAARDIERVRQTLTEQTPQRAGLYETLGGFVGNNRAWFAAAAAIVIVASLFALHHSLTDSPDTTRPISCFTLLSQACAAEETIFAGQEIVHVVNVILVYPASDQSPLSDRLDQFNLTDWQRDYLEKVSSWLDFNWLPLCSLQADGQFRFHELKLSRNIDQPYTITDRAWYERPTGRFIRVIETRGQVLFANSYDGQYIYFSEPGADGPLRLLSERATEDFSPPRNPAEFLGITAGLRASAEYFDYPPITETYEGKLQDGKPVRVYKQGFADLLGEMNTYWLFKVRDDDGTIGEMEFVKAGSPQLVIRRVRSETVESPEFSWNLQEIGRRTPSVEETSAVRISPDMWVPRVSVRHMADTAGFETYMFATTPSWLGPPQISDMVDFSSPGHRMFDITYEAADGRHIVICQSHTFNQFFASIVSHARSIYTSSNGFKVYGGGPEKWWTEIHLRGSGFEPAEDRSGYLLQSPAGTFPSLAVNGQLSEQELRQLVDSLMPARKLLKLTKEQVQELIENLPAGKMEDTYDPLTDPNNGMPADGLTKEQAMVRTAEEYWNAIIEEDWEYVAKLRPVCSAGFWAEKYGSNPVVELIKVGQPYEPKLPCSGLLVPCVIKRAHGKTIERILVVTYRVIDGRASCVIPALWGKPRVLE